MKTMVKTVVLLAILLLLSGAAFAQQCGCYTINAADLDSPENSCTRDVLICFDFETNLGVLASPAYDGFPKGIVMVLATFFDEISQKMTGAILADSVFLKFHGDRLHVVTGELFSTAKVTQFCGLPGPHRYELRGSQQEACGLTASTAGMDALLSQSETLLNMNEETLLGLQ